MVGSARRLSEELLLRRRRCLGRILDARAGRGRASAVARVGLRRRARIRRRRQRATHGGRRALLQRRGIRRRVHLSGDLAGARLALPLAPDANYRCSGGTRDRSPAWEQRRLVLSYFRTENRSPLFLKMLQSDLTSLTGPPCSVLPMGQQRAAGSSKPKRPRRNPEGRA